jgi:hypothetical protein
LERRRGCVGGMTLSSLISLNLLNKIHELNSFLIHVGGVDPHFLPKNAAVLSNLTTTTRFVLI